MANTSTKNFPHAYGAGRCVAAFSLSHPGGTTQLGEPSGSVQLPPPAFKMTVGELALLPSYPGATLSLTENTDIPGPDNWSGALAYTPDRQPYNATSYGVYVTGSGTKSLPYRSALSPCVPAAISPSLSQVLPGSTPAENEVRAFGLVDSTRLGSSHGQYVAEAVAPADPADQNTQGASYYEVALDWSVPTIRLSQSGTGFVDKSSWPSTQLANVRDSLARTFWVTASFGASAMSEAHPEAIYSFPFVGPLPLPTMNQILLNGALTASPTPDTGWEAMYGAPFTFTGDPNGSSPGPIEPSEAPTPNGNPEAAMQIAFPLVTEIHLKVTSVRQKLTNVDASGAASLGSTIDTVMEVAPVVRVFIPAGLAANLTPVPLGRTGVRPASVDGDTQPPCVNVQVWQKNSSATDGTIDPVFDLWINWSQLGGTGT